MSWNHELRTAICRRFAAARSGEDAGFSIIEVMVALAIFVIVSAGAVVGVIGGLHASTSSRDRVSAVNVAQNDLEQARANPSPVSTSYRTAPASTNAPTYSVTRSVSTILPPSAAPQAGCPAGGERHIAVTVRWSGRNGVLRLDTVVAC